MSPKWLNRNTKQIWFNRAYTTTCFNKSAVKYFDFSFITQKYYLIRNYYLLAGNKHNSINQWLLHSLTFARRRNVSLLCFFDRRGGPSSGGGCGQFLQFWRLILRDLTQHGHQLLSPLSLPLLEAEGLLRGEQEVLPLVQALLPPGLPQLRHLPIERQSHVTRHREGAELLLALRLPRQLFVLVRGLCDRLRRGACPARSGAGQEGDPGRGG